MDFNNVNKLVLFVLCVKVYYYYYYYYYFSRDISKILLQGVSVSDNTFLRSLSVCYNCSPQDDLCLFRKHSVFLSIYHLSITRPTSLPVYSAYSAGRLATLQPARHVPAIRYEVNIHRLYSMTLVYSSNKC